MSSPVDGDICGICFTVVHPHHNPRGWLNSCDHVFCSFCIKKWSGCTNVCPHCKARFTTIETFNAEGKESITKIRKRNYKLWEASDTSSSDGEDNESNAMLGNAIVCSVCGEGDNAVRIILCDVRHCSYTVHLDCIGLAERPAEFFCPSCLQERGAVPTPEPPCQEREETHNREASGGAETSASPDATHVPPAASPPAVSVMKKMSVPPPAILQRALAQCAQGCVKPSGVATRSESLGSVTGRHTCINQNTRSDSHSYWLSNGDDTIRRSSQAALHEYTERMNQRAHRENLQRHQKPLATQRGLSCNRGSGRMGKRHRSGLGAEVVTRGEQDLLNPGVRLHEETVLANQLSMEIMASLRRQQALDNNRLELDANGAIVVRAQPTQEEIMARDAALYVQASREAARLAHERIATKVAYLRMRRERIIQIQAQREMAALDRLAKMIARHRTGTDLSFS
uniref:RING-type domain-containing protein n=1 Tax=Trypanosoma congolense (strain IL3000) TaxID=1068625 RepID=G0UZB2_TRYCI|nr:conserved hypothetical protein [Trypanosoma congolense IL3000]